MGILIITGILFITGVIWWIVTGKKWLYPSDGAIITTVISGAILIVECISIVSAQSDFKKKIMDYHALEKLLESHRYEMNPMDRVYVIHDIHENNRVINAHRAHCDSFWIGLWYSEEIGNLEYLK